MEVGADIQVVLLQHGAHTGPTNCQSQGQILWPGGSIPTTSKNGGHGNHWYLHGASKIGIYVPASTIVHVEWTLHENWVENRPNGLFEVVKLCHPQQLWVLTYVLCPFGGEAWQMARLQLLGVQ